jgi:hypothetical protein
MKEGYTLLIAHPDDELLWCWPVLKQVKKIVCASSDAFNPERKRYRERKLCLKEVGQRLEVEIVCLDANSEFYRMPTRAGELKKHAAELMRHLESPVFTHNPWGEYGHLDHIFCNQIAMASGLEVWTSDICQEINWLPLRQWKQGLKSHKIDLESFLDLKRIYDARKCWTWDFPVTTECGLLKLC